MSSTTPRKTEPEPSRPAAIAPCSDSGAAESVSAGSQELSASAQSLSQGATEQASAAEEASASMEQMAANVKQNADNAIQTEKMSRQSAIDAQKSGDAVGRAVEVGHAGDVAAHRRRRPALGHGVDEAGDGLRRGGQVGVAGRGAPGREDHHIDAQRSFGVAGVRAPRRFGVPGHFLATPTYITASFGSGRAQRVYLTRA